MTNIREGTRAWSRLQVVTEAGTYAEAVAHASIPVSAEPARTRRRTRVTPPPGT